MRCLLLTLADPEPKINGSPVKKQELGTVWRGRAAIRAHRSGEKDPKPSEDAPEVVSGSARAMQAILDALLLRTASATRASYSRRLLSWARCTPA